MTASLTFADLGLGPELLRAVEDSGYTVPTPIQTQAIPYVLMGRDILGSAQTGTGKTASFTLPMIEILTEGRAKARMPRSLILCPTRELAAQVAESFDRYGKHHRLTKALLIGGVSFVEQNQLIDRGVDVLIATPGRLLDHFERGRILLNDIKILVIDEADRMLDMGFIPDVERIVDVIPRMRQTLFFSATIPPEIRRLADKFLINPKEVYVSPPASPAETVEQHLLVVAERDKQKALRALLERETVRNALIFCNRKKDVDMLTTSLKKFGFDAAALHGDMNQDARTKTLARFKANEIVLLVCSDVAARGLDINDLSHVFNFDVPFNAEDYIHRIGRTGRAGKQGRAFMLATSDDAKYLAGIQSLIGKDIPRLDLDKLTVAAPAAEEKSGDTQPRRRRRRTAEKPADEPKKEAEAPKKEAAAPKKEAAAPKPKRRSRRRREDAPKTAAVPEPEKKETKSAREPRKEGKAPLAFGDDMPAFFRR